MNKTKLVSTSYTDSSIIFRKEEIMNSWEQDWDDELIYFKIKNDGYITKVHLGTGDVYKYRMEEVAL
jgi:N6-adenosine-specific RNA methylase IME4